MKEEKGAKRLFVVTNFINYKIQGQRYTKGGKGRKDGLNINNQNVQYRKRLFKSSKSKSNQ